MKSARLNRIALMAVGVVLLASLSSRAEDGLPQRLTLHPMAAPVPALKYRLLPPADELVTGNAAVPYGKVTAEQMAFFARNFTDTIDKWRAMPLDKIRSETISLPDASILFLKQGAKCKTCDWQLPIGEVPFYTIILPDAQQTRSYARMLAVKARVEVANGKFDDAVNTFQTNYALARNVAQGETLVHGLIGIAIGSLMFDEVTAYVQQPAAPNLYWALTTLPSPLITMSDALDVERQALVLSFPELRDLETAHRSPEEWREVFHRIAKQIIEWSASGRPPVPRPMSVEELDKLCEEKLPVVKRRLMAGGISEEKINAMGIYQLALLYTVKVSREFFDDAAKYYSLPYPDAMQGMKTAFEGVKTATDAGEVIPLADATRNALESTRSAMARNDRRIALLRMFEALRLYAAAHDGVLPETLADIKDVPVPIDPVTNKPFDYHRDGNKATIRGPESGEVPVNYEITMEGKK